MASTPPGTVTVDSSLKGRRRRASTVTSAAAVELQSPQEVAGPVTRQAVVEGLLEHDPSLFAAGARFARAGGADMIEVIGMPEPVRSPLLCWQPRRRQYPSWPFLFRARDPGLHAALSDPHVWHAGLYDGDGSL